MVVFLSPRALAMFCMQRCSLVGKKLYLICNNGALVVDSLKPDGKSAMDGKAFAAGNKDIREGRATWSGIDGC